MFPNRKGFTLIELIVVMAVFMVIMIITGEAFKTILQQTSKVFRSEESNIEGVIGLEILRHDLQQIGYGLFTEPLNSPYTGEAIAAPASTYNDSATFLAPPRAVMAGNNLVAVTDSNNEDGGTFNVIASSDYLVLRGLTLGRSKSSQKWTYLNSAASVVTPKSWLSASENLETNDKTLLMRRNVTQSTNTLTIEPEPTNGFYFKFKNDAFSKYSTNYASFVVYGLYNDSANSAPRMPFNRSDYLVSRPSGTNAMPAICAPNIGNLYKGTVNQKDGKLSYVPVLDCVADMQVVFGWDLTIGSSGVVGQDGVIDTWSSPDPNFRTGTATLADLQAAMADAALLRSSLKMIKVYVLAQDGRKDTGYTSPSPIVLGDEGATLTKSYDITAANLQNYRWKVYRVVVRPKNLISNQ